MKGIKEGTCDEHGVLNVSDESLNSTPEINITHCMLTNLSLFYLINLFILREREKESASGGGTEREGKRIPNRLCTVSAELDVGARSHKLRS